VCLLAVAFGLKAYSNTFPSFAPLQVANVEYAQKVESVSALKAGIVRYLDVDQGVPLGKFLWKCYEQSKIWLFFGRNNERIRFFCHGPLIEGFTLYRFLYPDDDLDRLDFGGDLPIVEKWKLGLARLRLFRLASGKIGSVGYDQLLFHRGSLSSDMTCLALNQTQCAEGNNNTHDSNKRQKRSTDERDSVSGGTWWETHDPYGPFVWCGCDVAANSVGGVRGG
jgi:hypothetical protein